uniref:Collagenase 3 n=1 Tax=Amphilophus citrinellus TaxID=61819 RepID=A0A3Q0R515_AMPCI
MLCLYLLTLLMPSQTLMMALPLRTPDLLKTTDTNEDDDNWTTGLCDKKMKMKKMQRFFGLPPSGELTKETLAVMKKPRCGLSDVEHMNIFNGKNFIIRITGNKLPIPVSKVHKVFRAAWQLWSNVTPLKFHKRDRREADIVISFYYGDHKDGSPFDGKGGILAHAFAPGHGIGGDVHFDANESWSFNSTGINLFAVAIHEFGHALGLPHSPDPGAIMYPPYNFDPGYEPQLSFQDVKDIQKLYGELSWIQLPSKRPPPKTPAKCDPDLSFDAVTELQQEVLFFKDRFMWRKHPQFDETRITLISSLWPDTVPPNLDAVYQNVIQKYISVYYWVLRQLNLEEGFPRNLSTLGFPSRIKSVDAALHFRNDRYTVFFTGDECWRYNEQQKMMEGSPLLIEQQWPGIPTPLDAAVFYNGFTYLYSGPYMHEYSLSTGRLYRVLRNNYFLPCSNF